MNLLKSSVWKNKRIEARRTQLVCRIRIVLFTSKACQCSEKSYLSHSNTFLLPMDSFGSLVTNPLLPAWVLTLPLSSHNRWRCCWSEIPSGSHIRAKFLLKTFFVALSVVDCSDGLLETNIIRKLGKVALETYKNNVNLLLGAGKSPENQCHFGLYV